MENHDPGTHNSMLASVLGDIIKGDKNKTGKSSKLSVRLPKLALRLTMIGLLMASPFILLAALVIFFSR